jgi:predicted Zn-ribbon and HTH transcriptional regulator
VLVFCFLIKIKLALLLKDAIIKTWQQQMMTTTKTITIHNLFCWQCGGYFESKSGNQSQKCPTCKEQDIKTRELMDRILRQS